MTTEKTMNKLECTTYYPVDRGWAWIIFFAAFTVHVFSIGYERSFGLLYVEFQQKYGCSSTLMSAIVGTKAACYCLTTVIVMNVGLKKVSVRTSCLIGCVFQSSSVAACSLFDNPVSLIVTQGVLFGIGHGMLYCPTLFILAQYFERYRPIATAVASCGSCVGGIAFPMITRELLRMFGLSGTLLILGAILLHQMLVMVLYTPPGDYANAKNSSHVIRPESPSNSTEETRELVPRSNRKTELHTGCELETRLKSDENVDGAIVKGDSVTEESGKVLTSVDKLQRKEFYVIKNAHSLRGGFGDFSKDEHEGRLHLKAKVPDGASGLRIELLNRLVGSHSSLHSLPTKQQQFSRSHEFVCNLVGSNRKLSEIHSSMPMLFPGFDLSSNNGDLCPFRESDRHEELADVHSRCHDLEAVQIKDSCSGSTTDVALRKSNSHKCASYPAVMRLPLFWVLLFYFGGAVVGTAFPAVYIPALALEKGLTRRDGGYFLMISASVEIVGRFLPGFILHFQFMRPSQYMLVPASCLGVLYLMTSVFNDFTSLLLFSLAYGLMSSSFWPVLTLLVIEVLGMEHLASAIGFYSVFMGIACSTSYPFGGWLQDASGTYSTTFVFLGVMYLLSVVSLLVTQGIYHNRNRQKKAPSGA